jgi:hypothetical protein
MKINYMSEDVQPEIESVLDNEKETDQKHRSNNVHYTLYRLMKYKLNKNINHLKTKKPI